MLTINYKRILKCTEIHKTLDFTSYATVYEKHHEYFSSTLVKLLIHFNFPNIT